MVNNITGQKFGMLTALEPTEKRENSRNEVWRFQCDCGNVTEKFLNNVVSGKTRSCGCLAKKKKDLTGQKFGMLTALEPTEKRDRRYVVWKFRCDCGNVVEKRGSQVVYGNIRSCGCSKGTQEDITGRKFRMLTALGPTEKRDSGGSILWKFRCDCGNVGEWKYTDVVSGKTTNCGCRRRKDETAVFLDDEVIM